MRSDCSKFPHKESYSTREQAWKARQRLVKKFGADVVVDHLLPYECKDHWHLGRDWKLFNRRLKNALQVGTAVSRRQSRVRKRR